MLVVHAHRVIKHMTRGVCGKRMGPFEEISSSDVQFGRKVVAPGCALNQANEPARSPKTKSGQVEKADAAIRERQRQIQSTRVEIGHTYEESRREQTSWYDYKEEHYEKMCWRNSTSRRIEAIQDGQFDELCRQQ